MRTLLKNGTVVNVFTDELQRADVLIEDERIIGVGDYYEDADADIVEDVSGKYVCPGFVDGHIHIESTMLTPAEFARVCVPHGTTSVVTDPHEIANVCGADGIRYMLAASEGLPLTVYVMLPSCVPATGFDESGAVLSADDLRPFYDHPRVLGLAEMMNYPGVLAGDSGVMAKIRDALERGRVVDGHAPLLTGAALDRYISAGVSDDHECSGAEEALERVRKGQWLMIRSGTAAKNLPDLLPLFDEPCSRRCLLCTDDKHPADLLEGGHMDGIIRQEAAAGKSVLTAIRMATIQAAQCFGLRWVGAVAPGYRADILTLDNLERVEVCDVYRAGRKAASAGILLEKVESHVPQDLARAARASFHLNELTPERFEISPEGERCRVIEIVPGQLITRERIETLDWQRGNGIDLDRDILKLAVIERHHGTGHMGLGFITGTGLKRGAIASSVSHDSHNLIVIGTNEADMAAAANRIRALGGGNVLVVDGEVRAEMPLPIAGLMSEGSAREVARENEAVRAAVHACGAPEGIEPFMNMAFVSLSVIPSLKMTTQGLVDVDRQQRVPLFV